MRNQRKFKKRGHNIKIQNATEYQNKASFPSVQNDFKISKIKQYQILLLKTTPHAIEKIAKYFFKL